MCPSAPRVCSEPGGQKFVLSLSLDLIVAIILHIPPPGHNKLTWSRLLPHTCPMQVWRQALSACMLINHTCTSDPLIINMSGIPATDFQIGYIIPHYMWNAMMYHHYLSLKRWKRRSSSFVCRIINCEIPTITHLPAEIWNVNEMACIMNKLKLHISVSTLVTSNNQYIRIDNII